MGLNTDEMDLCLLSGGYLEVGWLVSRTEIPSVWEGSVWPLHCRGKDTSPGGLAARGLVFPVGPNLLDLIPPHYVAGFTKPIPDVHHRVEKNCCDPTGSCISSHYHQPELARKTFYWAVLVSAMVRSSWYRLAAWSRSAAVSHWGSDVLKDLALWLPVSPSRFAHVFWLEILSLEHSWARMQHSSVLWSVIQGHRRVPGHPPPCYPKGSGGAQHPAPVQPDLQCCKCCIIETDLC